MRPDRIPPRPARISSSRLNVQPTIPATFRPVPSRHEAARAVVLSSAGTDGVSNAQDLGRCPRHPAQDGPAASESGWVDEVKSWFATSGNSYLASMLFHTALFL